MLFKLEDSVTACKDTAACSWPHLVVLNLSNNSFGAPELEEVAKANWPTLRSLDLSCNTGAFIEELASAEWTTLQELNLSRLQLADSNMQQQLGSAHWPQLTALNLQRIATAGRFGVGFSWQSAPLQWPLLVKLQASWFMFNYVLTEWSSLTWLDVSSFVLTPEQVMTLPDACGHSLDTLRVACEVYSPVKVAPKLSSWPRNTFLHLSVLLRASVLQSLSLGYWPANQVDGLHDFDDGRPEGVKLVHQLVDVLELDLGVVQLHLGNFIPESLKHLAYGPWLVLQSLDLSSTCLKLVEIEHLVNARVSFRQLGLSNTDLTLEGVKQLILGHWPVLEALALSGNDLQTTKLRQLIKGRWPSLQSIDLHKNKVQSGDVKILLRAQWPNLACMCLTENSFNKRDSTGDYITVEESKQLCHEAEKDFKSQLQIKWSNIKLVV